MRNKFKKWRINRINHILSTWFSVTAQIVDLVLKLRDFGIPALSHGNMGPLTLVVLWSYVSGDFLPACALIGCEVRCNWWACYGASYLVALGRILVPERVRRRRWRLRVKRVVFPVSFQTTSPVLSCLLQELVRVVLSPIRKLCCLGWLSWNRPERDLGKRVFLVIRVLDKYCVWSQIGSWIYTHGHVVADLCLYIHLWLFLLPMACQLKQPLNLVCLVIV